MPLFLQVFLLSAVPLIEQRGAIPLGVLNGLSPWLTFVLALVGSLLPVVPILVFFQKGYAWASRRPKLKRLTRLIDKKIAKNVHKFDKYKELALITFVAIPLPTTGLWTGSLLAAFLQFDFKRSMFCMFLGGVISAAIITVLSVLAPGVLGAVAGH